MMLLRLLAATNSSHTQAVVSLKDEGTVGPKIKELGIPVYSLGLRRLPNPIRTFSLIPLMKRFQPDLIQGWMYHANLVASLAGASWRKGVPVLWNVRNALHDLANERRLTGAVIRFGGMVSRRRPVTIIYNSQTSARQHGELGYHSASQIVIPNGFDCGIFRPDAQARRQVRSELGLDQDAPLIGLIARYHPIKGHANFLRAAGIVARDNSQANFLLAGEGATADQAELMNLIEEQQLGKRVFLLGERSDIPRLAASLDIACSASSSEAFSNAVGEAMACGVPCVATDVGDSALLVADTGLTVAPRSPEALAGGISRLLNAGFEHRRNLGAAARLRVETHFSLPVMVGRYEEVYQESLAQSNKSLQFENQSANLDT